MTTVGWLLIGMSGLVFHLLLWYFTFHPSISGCWSRTQLSLGWRQGQVASSLQDNKGKKRKWAGGSNQQPSSPAWLSTYSYFYFVIVKVPFPWQLWKMLIMYCVNYHIDTTGYGNRTVWLVLLLLFTGKRRGKQPKIELPRKTNVHPQKKNQQ